MTLATTAGLPVLRGPVQLAKTLGAIDVLSGGRLVVGVGPGSSADDYGAAGLRFQERWRRFDEALAALRVLLHGDATGFEGEFYSTRDVMLEPRPVQRPGRPIWIASWGSPAGLRRVARLGDGWLASAYNTTPGPFPRGPGPACRGTSARRQVAGVVSERDRYGLAAHHRRQGRRGPDYRRRARADAAPHGRGAALCPTADRPRGGVRRAAHGVRGCGRPTDLRLAARRRGAAAGTVPRARQLPRPAATVAAPERRLWAAPNCVHEL
jgi:alkanesulfonate monooxygenase SsuD/methylene tetrahydromethanopterin reductase-like flavin-dependent oxidoreductase (luciferase family)